MTTTTTVGLFFGSFNPVHVGHLILANHIAQFTELQEVWLVVSPHNPLKAKASLANDYDRLHLVQLAIGDNPLLRASDIEFGLPKPSYTIDTLTYLQEKYPSKRFALIMGADSLASLPKWKNYEHLLAHHQLYVYRRPGYELGEFQNHPHVKIVEAPLLDISATFIRQLLKERKSVQYLVPDTVCDFLQKSTLYR